MVHNTAFINVTINNDFILRPTWVKTQFGTCIAISFFLDQQLYLTDDDLAPLDEQRVLVAAARVRLDAEEHDVGEHVAHQQREAARQTLHRREATARRAVHDREPQVPLAEATVVSMRSGEREHVVQRTHTYRYVALKILQN